MKLSATYLPFVVLVLLGTTLAVPLAISEPNDQVAKRDDSQSPARIHYWFRPPYWNYRRPRPPTRIPKPPPPPPPPRTRINPLPQPSVAPPPTNTPKQTSLPPTSANPLPPSVAPPPVTSPSDQDSGSGWQGQMLQLVNAERAKYGKQPLKLDPGLVRAAQMHSDYQNSIRTMTHNSPYGDIMQRMKPHVSSVRSAAENVAFNQRSVEQVMQTWIKSPGHLQNILGNFNIVGFGQTNWYWTQQFVMT